MSIYDKNIENLVISMCLKSPELLDMVSQKVTEDDFYLIENRVMYAAIDRLRLQSRRVDGAVVAAQIELDERFVRCQFYDEFGYPPKEWALVLEQLDDTHQNHEGYVEELINASISRSMLSAGQKINDLAHSNLNSDEKLTSATGALSNIADRIEPDDIPTMRQIVMQSLVEFNAAIESGQSLRGIPTGYKQIDKALSGLIKGELYVIAAKSGSGKTTFALNIAQNIAKHSQVKIFSLEMPSSQLATRMACRERRVPLSAVLNGTADDTETEAYSEGMRSVLELGMTIDDRAAVTIEQLKSRARMAKIKENVDLIVVDYLQYLKCPKQDNRTMEITRISNGLKEIAKELDIPVIALSQLNRENEKRGNKRHVMSDLKESSAIEHDACAVLFIYDPTKYENVAEDAKNNIEIDIAKNRHGRTGKHWLVKDWAYGNFIDWDENRPYPESSDVKKLSEFKNNKPAKFGQGF